MNVEFLSAVAVIAPDPAAGCELYVGALGLPLEGQSNGYYHSERIAGCKSFGIWPLSQAAEAGQTVARLQSPEGAIVGISYIPMFHDAN